MKVNIRNHFILALALGIFFRFLSLHYVWGPQALDDYLDNLIPAWKHFVGIDPDLHNYRSPLYLWILSSWIRIGSVFGIENPIPQIQWVYALQGATSLLAIFAAYLLLKRNENKLAPMLSMYLLSLHGLLPFATTRSFMESFVLGPITLGLVLLFLSDQSEYEDSEQKNNYLVWGLILLGLSSLIRFQSGIIYVAWTALMFLTRKKKQFLAAIFFGLILISAEALIDLGYGRYAFQTLHDYFAFNSDQQKSGIMPWYNTVLALAGMVYFPFTALLGKSWLSPMKKYWKLIFPVFIYFLVHTINPHKEERYLYPILGIVFIVWGIAWADAWPSKLVRWVFNPIFVLLNTLVLFIACFVNTQVSLVGPLADIQSQTKSVLVLDHDQINMRQNMAEFFIRKPSLYQIVENIPNADFALVEFAKHPELESLALLSVKKENAQAFEETWRKLSVAFKCSEIFEATSLSDQILYRLRPERNERRQPTKYFFCKKN